MSNSRADQEIAALLSDLIIDGNTNLADLFNLPLNTQNNNALLKKFLEFVRNPDT